MWLGGLAIAYLKDITGLNIETFEASDYNGVIQAISSGQVDIATMGGGSYANVDAQVGRKVLPFLTIRQAEGGLGYYSALIVKADSPYKTLDDLKGKSIAYVDFNSTSGYIFRAIRCSSKAMTQKSIFQNRSWLAERARRCWLWSMAGLMRR